MNARRSNCLFAFGCFAVLLLLSAMALAQGSPNPDLLLLNGHILTMNPAQPSAEAVAIRQDRIVWVGTNQDARKRFLHVRTRDLHGATVLPGIIDAHTHLVELGKSLLRLNLKDAATPDAAVELVKKQVAITPPGEWILGWGWDEGKWASAYPDNEALSKISPNNPVLLTGLHSFAAWANKRALQIAGVTRETPDPENGKIVRDEKTGEPVGILLNHAQELVERHIPPMSLENVKKAMELAADECVRNGLTSVHEARVSGVMVQALHELVREGRMPLRVYVMLDGADPALVKQWLARGPEIDSHHRLTIRAFKLFADGALGSRGAALLEPYSDVPGTKGLITTPEEAVYGLTRSSLQKGFQVCTHAIGDGANRMVLDSYERALQEVPEARDARLRVEHAQVLAPQDIPRFAKQSLLETGVHLPLSSDFPGETLNPFYGIYAAITRQDPQGNPAGGWFPEQKLTLDEALRGYTLEGAYAEFEEKDKGSIETGKLADLTVISADITKIAPRDILSIRVLNTFVGGKLVWEGK